MSQTFGRRDLLRWSGALLPVAGGIESLHAEARRGGQPRNIIWMVTDGMSPGVLPLADRFSQLARGKGTIWQALSRRPEATQAMMDMASLESMVTDSSSASSAWGSGSRLLNGSINVLPDGTRLTPIAVLARDKKKRIGVVTTTTVTHATPAGFVAISPSRDDEAAIARQYLSVCDVALGGGSKFFTPELRQDKRDVLADFAKAGFAIARTRKELGQAAAGRLLGLFGEGYLPYSLDQRSDQKLRDEVPSLAEMTQAALDRLANAPAGFLLQVEGGRVDHAAHNNDVAALLWDYIAFDEALGVVLRFTERHPETLVVITTDHGTASPALNGTGREYADTNASFERALAARNSFTVVTPRLGVKSEYTMKTESGGARPKAPAGLVKDVVRTAFGFEPSPEEIDWLRIESSGAKGVTISRQLDKMAGVLGQVVGNHTGVGWTGTSHTSDYTLLTALGPGSPLFHGFLRNTDVFPILCTLMDIHHRNPSMTPERARDFQKETAAMRTEEIPHWA